MADTRGGLTRAQVEGARRQAEVCGETALQAIDRGPRRVRDAGWHEGCVYQWARLAAHYARTVVAQEEANAAVAAGLDSERRYVHTGLRAAQDEEGERYRAGIAEPPTTCDVCREIIPDGEGRYYFARLLCARCAR